MRITKLIPKTDLKKLSKEVLSRGASAAMPKNLPDRWLHAIGRDLLKAQKSGLAGIEDDPTLDLNGAILLVMALRGNLGMVPDSQAEISPDELAMELNRYTTAVSEEIVGRQTGVFIRSIDLRTPIF